MTPGSRRIEAALVYGLSDRTLFHGGRIVGRVLDLRDELRPVDNLPHLLSAFLYGIGNQNEVGMAVSVGILGVQGARDHSTVGQRGAHRLADVNLDFVFGHAGQTLLRPDGSLMRGANGWGVVVR